MLMNARPDYSKTAYRWVFVACSTLLLVQLVSRLSLGFRGYFVSYQLAIEMVDLPRVITEWSGWCLLIASAFYFRVKDPLFYFGLTSSALAIWVAWEQPFIFA
jgi:hypothetical protein